jgi:5-methylcytosine-specific restriction protein A
MTSLYDRHWRRRRAEQLRREPLCKLCQDLHDRVTGATVADHVTPHRGDPGLFRGPLQSLCASCHSTTKQQIELTGRIRGCDVNGHPLDPQHPWNVEARGGSSNPRTGTKR